MTVAVGARPVFADIVSLDEPTIDPADIERLTTPRTKAIVVMHYGGYVCRMAEIGAICQRHGLALIEDACHAVGARYLDQQQRPPHGKMAGNLGDIACFSFFSNKNLAVGEGGMVVTNRDDLAERLRLLRSHGMTTLTWDRHRGHAASYDVKLNGYNYRLDELRAALGRVELAKLLHANRRRRQRVAQYQAELKAAHGIQVVFPGREADSACHLEVILARDNQMRDGIRQGLTAKRIQTSLHYPAIPDFSAFVSKNLQAGDTLPKSREFAVRAVTLPLYASMGDKQVAEVCQAIQSIVQ